MTDRGPAAPLPRPAPAAAPGPARRPRSTTSSRRASSGSIRDNPVLATSVGLHAGRRPAGRRQPRAVLGRARRGPRPTSPPIEALDPAGLSPDGPVRARPGDPQRPPGRSSTPTSCASGSAARSPSTPSATGCSCCSRATTRRWPSGSTRSPAGWRPRPRYLEEAKTRATVPQVRPLAADRDRDRGGPAVVLRRARRRRAAGRPPGRRAAPPRARERVGQDRRRAVRRLARGRRSPAAPTTGRSGASATTRWSACARSTASTPTRSSSSAGSSWPRSTRRRAARRARDRSRRRRGDRHRAGQVGPARPTFEEALDGYRDGDGPRRASTSSSATS